MSLIKKLSKGVDSVRNKIIIYRNVVALKL